MSWPDPDLNQEVLSEYEYLWLHLISPAYTILQGSLYHTIGHVFSFCHFKKNMQYYPFYRLVCQCFRILHLPNSLYPVEGWSSTALVYISSRRLKYYCPWFANYKLFSCIYQFLRSVCLAFTVWQFNHMHRKWATLEHMNILKFKITPIFSFQKASISFAIDEG